MRRIAGLLAAITLTASFHLSIALPGAADDESNDVVERTVSEANALLLKGRAEQARALLEPLAKKHPDSAPVQYGLAQAAIIEGDLKKARKLLEKTIELDDDHLDAKVVLAKIYRTQKKTKDARKLLEEVLEKEPQSATALRGMGDVERASKKFTRAAAWYEKALKARPEDLKVLLLSAEAWTEAAKAQQKGSKKKRNEYGGKAITAYRKLLESKPDIHEVLLHVGTVAFLCERYDDSAEALEQFLEERPDNPNGYKLLALVREKQERPGAAVKAWSRFIELAKGQKAFRKDVSYAKRQIKALSKTSRKK